MADECTDVSNKEQFTICIRWVDEKLVDHEDMIGMYNVDAIDANCLVSALRMCFYVQVRNYHTAWGNVTMVLQT